MNDLHSQPVQTPASTVRPATVPEATSPREPERGEFCEQVAVRVHSVRGGGGLPLAVFEAGDPDGPPLLFLHGFSQCHLAWCRQFQSALGLGFRLVAVDLRGHGYSEKPLGGYGNSGLWADDIQAVISELHLERPLLVGWSYGAMVIADYLRHYGQAHLAGIHFVSALVKSGSEEAFALFAPEMLSLIPGLFASEDAACQASLESFTSLLFHQPVAPEIRTQVLAYNQRVPSYVREGLGSRSVDNDDVLRRLTLPVLVSHGLEDRVLLPDSSHHIASLVPDAQVSFYAGVGHSPFWEDSRRFNRELVAFAARCW
jgi:non-heme chloroperoxidase